MKRKSSSQRQVARARRQRRAVSKTLQNINNLIHASTDQAELSALQELLKTAAERPAHFKKQASRAQAQVRAFKSYLIASLAAGEPVAIPPADQQ